MKPVIVWRDGKLTISAGTSWVRIDASACLRLRGAALTALRGTLAELLEAHRSGNLLTVGLVRGFIAQSSSAGIRLDSVPVSYEIVKDLHRWLCHVLGETLGGKDLVDGFVVSAADRDVSLAVMGNDTVEAGLLLSGSEAGRLCCNLLDASANPAGPLGAQMRAGGALIVVDSYENGTISLTICRGARTVSRLISRSDAVRLAELVHTSLGGCARDKGAC